MRRKAVVLLSGGLDSSTVLFWAKKRGYKCLCLLFDYGQRHARELKAAKKIALKAGFPYKVVKIRLLWDKSSLIDKNKKLPEDKLIKSRGHEKPPSTYVPGRNTIFLSYALSLAETMEASRIFIGANAVDYSGYPDCRPGYYNAMNKVLKALGTGVRVQAPLLKLKKSEIIKLGLKLNVPHEVTWSCYSGRTRPCGKCDSCRFRKKGFKEAGAHDPALKIC